LSQNAHQNGKNTSRHHLDGESLKNACELLIIEHDGEMRSEKMLKKRGAMLDKDERKDPEASFKN